MVDVKVGQMAKLVQKDEGENAWWQYLVAVNVFDDRVEFLKEDGGRYMHIFSDDHKEILDKQVTSSSFALLKKNREPVFSKKSFFTRKYNFLPKY